MDDATPFLVPAVVALEPDSVTVLHPTPATTSIVPDSTTPAPLYLKPFLFTFINEAPPGPVWDELLWSEAVLLGVSWQALLFNPSAATGAEFEGVAVNGEDDSGEIIGYAVFEYTGPEFTGKITYDWGTDQSVIELRVFYDFTDADPGPPEFSPVPTEDVPVAQANHGGPGVQGASGAELEFTIPESVAKRVGIFIRVAAGAPGAASITGQIENIP